jgi:hypothetical protein
MPIVFNRDFHRLRSWLLFVFCSLFYSTNNQHLTGDSAILVQFNSCFSLALILGFGVWGVGVGSG